MMKNVKMIPLAASLAAILMVNGCSDNYMLTEETDVPVVTVEGSAFDGAIDGATVCIDVSDDSKCDADEPQTTTDVLGKYSMDSQGKTGPLFMRGGTDRGTGKPFTGTLSAPLGSTVVSPLTSAIQSLVKGGATPEAAETSIKKAFNVKSTASLTSYNPFTAADEGDTDAKEILAAQSQLQTLVHAVSSSVADVDADTSIADSMADAMTHIAKSLETAATLAGEEDVVISNKLVSDAVKSTANTVLEGKPAAQVAVKSVADTVATAAVAVAESTKTSIEAADLTVPGAVALASNTGILVANDAMQTTIETSTTNAATETAKLSATDVAEIQTAQIAQETADAKIVEEAVKVAEKVAETVAAEKALAESATQENIVAAQEAAAAQAEAEAAEALAQEEAAKAAAAAAALEAKVAADAAAAKAAAAALAEAEAAAAKALAEAEQLAAEEAAIAAADAKDAEAAALAAAEKEAAHAAAIAAAEAEAEAARIAAEEEAARVAEEAAAEAAAAAEEARIAAEEAAALAKAIEECDGLGGEYIDGKCITTEEPIVEEPIVTGAVS